MAATAAEAGLVVATAAALAVAADRAALVERVGCMAQAACPHKLAKIVLMYIMFSYRHVFILRV